MPAHHLSSGTAAAALYLHIPFCLSKCSYCSFNSYPLDGQDPAAYIEALKKQIILTAEHPLIKGALFDTVYIGGGTPTCIEPGLLLNLLSSLKKNFRLAAESEITIEANPGSISCNGLASLVSAGVNRISLGVQSFSRHLLRITGRRHSPEDIHLGVEKIRKAGFANLSLDLILGLPGQSLRDFKNSLETALSLEPQHLSIYELTLETGAPMAVEVEEGGLALPAEDLVVEMMETARTTCREKGLKQYEIANFAREGYCCRHNLHYWHNHNYLGLGAGAVSGWHGLRITSEAIPGFFIRRLKTGGHPVTGAEGLCRQAGFRETVIMGLRLIKGISIEDMEKRFGISPLAYYGGDLTSLLDTGFIEIKGDRLRLTEKGLPVANQILSRLV